MTDDTTDIPVPADKPARKPRAKQAPAPDGIAPDKTTLPEKKAVAKPSLANYARLADQLKADAEKEMGEIEQAAALVRERYMELRTLVQSLDAARAVVDEGKPLPTPRVLHPETYPEDDVQAEAAPIPAFFYSEKPNPNDELQQALTNQRREGAQL